MKLTMNPNMANIPQLEARQHEGGGGGPARGLPMRSEKLKKVPLVRKHELNRFVYKSSTFSNLSVQAAESKEALERCENSVSFFCSEVLFSLKANFSKFVVERRGRARKRC